MEQANSLVKLALNEVVQQVNAGTAPTDALKKTASELDLNPNYIQRVGEALNVALHYKHFKTASDRSSEFMLADIPSVVENIFNGKEKTSAEYVSEHFSTHGGNDEVFNYNRILSNPRYKKAYLQITQAGESDAHDSYALSFKGAFDKSAALLRSLEQTLENAKTDKVGAEIALNQSFSKLADHFRRDENYRGSFAEMESQVFSKYAEKAEPYLDLLYKTSGISEARGVHDNKYVMFTPAREASLFDTFMKASSDMCEADSKLKQAEEDYCFEKEYYTDICKLIGKSANHKKYAESYDAGEAKKKEETSSEEKTKEIKEEDPVLKKIEENMALDKDAGFLGSFAVGNLLNKYSPTSHIDSMISDSFFGGKNKKNTGARANVTLDNMERQLLLQDLMMTDPILSKIPPAKLAKAYEQILRLSPQVSKEKEVVRAMLRQAVASQAVAPHDADQWTRLDTDILRRKITSDNYLRGGAEPVKF